MSSPVGSGQNPGRKRALAHFQVDNASAGYTHYDGYTRKVLKIKDIYRFPNCCLMRVLDKEEKVPRLAPPCLIVVPPMQQTITCIPASGGLA